MENTPQNSLSLAAARVSYGRAESVGAAWQQIRRENEEAAVRAEMRRQKYWRKVARKNNPARRLPKKENLVNKHRRFVHLNSVYRAFFYVRRHWGLSTTTNPDFYAVLRRILRKIYGRNLAKRAFARHSAGVLALISAELQKSYSQSFPRSCLWTNRVSHPHARNCIYYLKNNNKVGQPRGEHPPCEHSAQPNDAPRRGFREKHLEADSKNGAEAPAIKKQRKFLRRLTKTMRRKINRLVDWVAEMHFVYVDGEFVPSGTVLFSRKHVFNLCQFSIQHQIPADNFLKIYRKNLRKWNEIGTYQKTRYTRGKQCYFVPSGLSGDVYDDLEKITFNH